MAILCGAAKNSLHSTTIQPDIFKTITFDGGVLPLQVDDFVFEDDDFLTRLLTDGLGESESVEGACRWR